MISASASKLRDVRFSVQKDYSALKSRRSVSVDTRARGSYVPDRKRPSSEERRSGNRHLDGFNRWSGTRKSSINLCDAKRKDVRPLTDKQYQKKKVADLVEFLESTAEFKYPISTTKLAAPSKKDFENIFQFLYSYFDPSYEVKKIEEEAPKIIKNLGYPFAVTKSAFLYVARTHWPSLLGVLIWLMNLNKFARKVDIQSVFESAGTDEKSQMHAILLRFICQCYHSGIDNEQEEKVVFKNIVTSLMTENVDELTAKNEAAKLLLSSLEKELNEIRSLADQKAKFDDSIEKYEVYIVKMKSHYQKKNELYEQLIDQLKGKEAELKDLQDDVAKRQDAYDAQGFDGKKQLNFIEMQKKELTEKVEKKQAVVKDLQDKIWEDEIQQNKNLDKVNAASESYNELYNTAIHKAKTVLQPLQSIKTPQIQKLCNSFYLDFPSWEIPPRTKTPDWKILQENALENMTIKVKGINEIFRRISSSQSEKINEAQMKKSDLSMRLKVLSVREDQLNKECSSKEKQAVDEVTSLESQYDKVFKAVQGLQAERMTLEKTYKEMSNELTVLEAFGAQKEKELKEYLADQSQIFEYCSSTEQEVTEKSLLYGEEIYEKMEKLLL